MYTAHKCTCCRIRTEVVARGKGSSGIVHVITFVFGECKGILDIHIDMSLRDQGVLRSTAFLCLKITIQKLQIKLFYYL